MIGAVPLLPARARAGRIAGGTVPAAGTRGIDGAPAGRGDAAVRINEDYARARDELAPPSHLARSSLPARAPARAASKA